MVLTSLVIMNHAKRVKSYHVWSKVWRLAKDGLRISGGTPIELIPRTKQRKLYLLFPNDMLVEEHNPHTAFPPLPSLLMYLSSAGARLVISGSSWLQHIWRSGVIMQAVLWVSSMRQCYHISQISLRLKVGQTFLNLYIPQQPVPRLNNRDGLAGRAACTS